MNATMLSNPFANAPEPTAGGIKWLPPTKGQGRSKIIYAKAGGVQKTIRSTDCFTITYTWASRSSVVGSNVEGTLRGHLKGAQFPLYDFRQAHTVKNSLLSKIRGLLDLEPGWDGYAAKVPAGSAIDEAEQFASSVLPTGDFQLPAVTAAADGEVNFSWRNLQGYIDLGFYGDGSYSFYAKTAAGEEFMSDESSVTEQLPEQVLKIIRGN
ncbi:hypothetical protein [Pseudomonas sp. A2]|uniref:hypothetical protein n=1 Tax=unclassified Pseudomonas TaxID=196821 RepID=UPI002C8339C4|nr:hypothetical protein [Pseudomonas sp. A2]MEB3438218.1 hypothetical protein [Pseudomonas sp. A2]